MLDKIAQNRPESMLAIIARSPSAAIHLVILKSLPVGPFALDFREIM